MGDDSIRSICSGKRISLRLWVFKFIEVEGSDSFGVCVEGYRPNDGTETVLRNWHSTFIEKRLTSSLLSSRSGTIYELRGCIDKELAFQYGYPLTLVNLFINGFPENWRDVLKEYFHVLKATNSLNTSHFSSVARRRSSSTVRGHSQSKITHRTSSLSTVLPEVIHEERHEGEESSIAERVQEEEDRIRDAVGGDGDLLIQNTTAMDSGNHLMDKCAAECRPSSPERTRQSSAEPIIQSPVSISSQSNRRDCENELIEVESYSDRGSSRPGCTRGESVSLSNSRAVVLAGLPFNINSSARQTNFKGQSDDAVELTGWSIRFTPAGSGGPPLGFPKFVLLGTRKNHPVQWQSSVVVRVESASIIHTSSTKYRLVGEMNIVDSAYAGFPKLFVSMFLQGFPPDWRTRIAELYNDFFGHLNMPSGNEVGAIDSSRRHRLSQENEVTESRTFREVDEEPCIDDSLHRPERHAQDNALVPLHGQQSSADVRRSRSGRCLRPPLANWAGQRVRYDGAGNVIGIEDVNTSTILSRRITDTSALSKYYGISPPTTSRQCEKYLDVPELAADRGAKKLKKKKVTYSDSSDSENERRKKRVVASSSEDDDDSRGYHHKRKQADWEIDDLASDMRKERQLILKQARELQKQQEYLQKKQKELMAIERRIAEKEAIWRKKTKKIERNKSVRKQSVYNGDDGEDMANYRHTKSKTGARNGCNRLPRFVDDDERRYVDEREQQRRRIEVEWARQNEQYSSASDQIDDDSYQEPVHKKRKKLQRKERVVYSTSEDSPSKSEDSENDTSEESIDRGKHRPELGEKKEKGWSRAELDRLKLALKAIRVCNDDDWEKVARSLGNTRDRDSCKEAAIRRLKWEPPVNGVESPQVTSETVTARAGTIAYQHQANEYTRKFMMGGGVQGEDFFRNKDISLCESIPDVAEFGADDSLLEAIRTPVDAAAQRKGCNRRQFLAEAIDEETPDRRRRSSAVLVKTPTDSVQRERHDRYLHHLMNKGGLRNNDISRANYSRIANSTRNETMREGLLTKNANTFANLHQDLEGVAKMTRKASRRNTATEDSDMDLELDENYFDDMDDL